MEWKSYSSIATVTRMTSLPRFPAWLIWRSSSTDAIGWISTEIIYSRWGLNIEDSNFIFQYLLLMIITYTEASWVLRWLWSSGLIEVHLRDHLLISLKFFNRALSQGPLTSAIYNIKVKLCWQKRFDSKLHSIQHRIRLSRTRI